MDGFELARKTELENLLKIVHEHRESVIMDVLRNTRKPENYLRRIEREDGRYYAVTEAIREYFKSVEELG